MRKKSGIWQNKIIKIKYCYNINVFKNNRKNIYIAEGLGMQMCCILHLR